MNWIFLQTLRGSFSAVSTPIFASKYALESSWWDLQDVDTFAPLRSQNFSQKSSNIFSRMNDEFPSFFIFSVELYIFSANFWWHFVRISRQIPEKSDVCRFLNQICENKLENCRKFWNQNSVKIIHYYSLLFICVLNRDRSSCAL